MDVVALSSNWCEFLVGVFCFDLNFNLYNHLSLGKVLCVQFSCFCACSIHIILHVLCTWVCNWLFVLGKKSFGTYIHYIFLFICSCHISMDTKGCITTIKLSFTPHCSLLTTCHSYDSIPLPPLHSPNTIKTKMIHNNGQLKLYYDPCNTHCMCWGR